MEVVITNNPMVRDRFSDKNNRQLEFYDTDYIGILKTARDRIHLGHSLLTHPLSGSLKPGEIPYKTIVISAEKRTLDENALSIIEESIQTYMKFTAKRISKNIEVNRYSDKVLKDFQLIDYELIEIYEHN